MSVGPDMIVCVVPQATEYGRVAIGVYMDDKQIEWDCDSCAYFDYSVDAKPILREVTPNAATNSETFTVRGKWNTPHLSYAAQLLLGKTGQNLVSLLQKDWIPDEDIKLNFKVTNLEAGYYNATHWVRFRGLADTSYLSHAPTYFSSGFSNNRDPFDFLVIPRVDSINIQNISTRGGLIRITGSGFSSQKTNNIVQLGPASCTVTSSDFNNIACTVTASRLTNFPSTPSNILVPGLKRVVLREEYFPGALGSSYPYSNLSFSSHFSGAAPSDLNIGDDSSTATSSSSIIQIVKGYFHAPVTGAYRFSLTGGNRTEFRLNTQAPLNLNSSTQDPQIENLQPLCKINNYTLNREYLKDTEPNIMSTAIQLEENKYYYFEVWNQQTHDNGSARTLHEGGWFSLGVELPVSAGANSSNAIKPFPSILTIEIRPNPVYEELYFKIWNLNSSDSNALSFQILFRKTNSEGIQQSHLTLPLPAYPTPQMVQQAIWAAVGYETDVSIDYFNANEENTSDIDSRRGFGFTLTLKNYRNDRFMPVIITNNSDLSLENPNPVKISVRGITVPSDPVRGTWSLTYNNTRIGPLSYSIDDDVLENYLESKFGWEHIQVVNNKNADDGSKFSIFMLSPIPNFNVSLLTADSSGLSGGGTGNVNISFSYQQSSNNVFYDPIPYEFLNSVHFESLPRINVTSNGIVADCRIGNNCSFRVVSDSIVPTVSAASWNATANILTLTLSNYGMLNSTSDPAQYDIQVQGSRCLLSGPINLTEPNGVLTCSFDIGYDGNPVYRAGAWLPDIQIKGFGYLKVDPVANIEFELGQITITPNLIGRGGGEILTFQGAGLGAYRADPTSMDIGIGSQICEIISWSQNRVVLISPPVTEDDDMVRLRIAPLRAALMEISYRTDSPQITSISPAIGSAVSQTEIEILGKNFGENVNIHLINIQDNKIKYPCIIEAGAITPTSIICLVAGGIPGVYTIDLHNIDTNSSNRAQIQDPSIRFTFALTLYNITSKVGTILGQSQVTLNGQYFGGAPSNVKIEIYNPTTKVYYDCKLIMLTDTEVRFFTPTVPSSFTGIIYFVVSELERYTCNKLADCYYTFVNDTNASAPVITAVNATSGKGGDVILMQGKNLAGLELDYRLSVLIGEVEMNVISANGTAILLQLPQSLPADRSSRLVVNVPGWGNAFFSNQTSLLPIDYEVSSISRNVLPIGGGLITVNGYGFNKYSQVSIHWANGDRDLCSISDFVTSEQIYCIWLNTQKHPHGMNGTVHVTNLNGLEVKTCKSSSCVVAIDSSIFGIIENISLTNMTDGTIQVAITGTNFGNSNELKAFLQSTAGLRYVVSVTRLNSTSLEINFDPRTIPSDSYSILISNLAGDYALYNTTDLINIPLIITNSTDYGPFSAVGGAEFQVLGGGFGSDSRVYICGFPVVTYSVVNSTNIYVTLPPIIKDTLISEGLTPHLSQVLTGYPISDTIANADAAFDGDLLTAYKSSSQNTSCYVGLNFGEQQVVRIDQIRFFINFDVDPRSYQGGVWEGANDNTTWTTIATLDWNVLEYWTIIDIPSPSNSTRYQFVRYRHPQGACALAEIQIVGQRMLAQGLQADTTNCSYRVESNGNVAQSGSSISLQISKNPGLIFVYQGPVTVSVEGGDILTFMYSSNSTVPFPTDSTLYSLKIEGCSAAFPTIDETSQTISFISKYCPTLPALTRDIFKTPQLKLSIDGFKEVTILGQFYGYFSYWSNPMTWKRNYLPRDGEDVVISSNMRVILDIDTARLRSLRVEGFLLVQNPPIPQSNWTVDLKASRIYVPSTGFFVAGRADEPLTGMFSVTLIRDETQPPVDTSRFSNVYPRSIDKLFQSEGGYIEFYGHKRNATATILASPAKAGDFNISAINPPSGIDWRVGEEIALVASDYTGKTEVRSIESIVATNESIQIVLNDSLKYNHYRITDLPEDKGAETGLVLLLSRNVVIQSETDTNFTNVSSTFWQYGGEMIYEGANNLAVESHLIMDNVRFKSMGKPFNQGLSSAIRLANIWEGSRVRLSDNVIYYPAGYGINLIGANRITINSTIIVGAMGHGITNRGGFERGNTIINNFIIGLRTSSYHSFSDMTGYALTTTDGSSNYAGNIIGGNEGFGFSMTPLSIIPREAYAASNTLMNSFVRQSCNLSGLVSFANTLDGILIDGWTPRQYISPPLTNPLSNPYNVLEFAGIQVYSNGKNGFKISRSSPVSVSGITSAFNLMSQIATDEASVLFNSVRNHYKDVFLKGISDSGWNVGSNLVGATSPSRGTVYYENIHCANLSTCFDTCYQCSDSDLWTAPLTIVQNYTGTNITVSDFVLSKERDVLRSDSSNFVGNNTAGTLYLQNGAYPHLSTLCTLEQNNSSQICEGVGETVKFVSLTNFTFNEVVEDSSISLKIKEMTSGNTTQLKGRQSSWTIPLSTTQGSYRIELIKSNNITKEWSSFAIIPATAWSVWDENMNTIYLELPFSLPKKDVQVSLLDSDNITVTQGVLTEGFIGQERNGDFILNNTNRTITVALNGKRGLNHTLLVKAISCTEDDHCGGTFLHINETINYSVLSNWSDPSSWPSGKVPVDGEMVIIDSGVELLLDVSTANLSDLIIDGSLFISPDSGNLQITASNIWVRRGKLQAGTKSIPFPPSVKFTILLTSNEGDSELLAQSVDAGNNVLLVTGTLGLFGSDASDRSSPSILTRTAKRGSANITLSIAPAWNQGDKLIITTTDFETNHTELNTVAGVSDDVVTLSSPLNYTHFGESHSLPNLAGYQAKVFNVERNIIIKAANTSYGCRIHIGNFIDHDGTLRTNQELVLVATQILNGGQNSKDSRRGAIKADVLEPNYIYNYIQLQDVVLYDLNGPGIELINSNNITIRECLIHNARSHGVMVLGSLGGLNLQDITVVNVRSDPVNLPPNPILQEEIVGIYFKSDTPARNPKTYKILNCWVIGSESIGFAVPETPHGQSIYWDRNGAIATQIGWLAASSSGASSSARSLSNFTAWRNQEGILYYGAGHSLTVTNNILADNRMSLTVNLGDINNSTVIIQANTFIGTAISISDTDFHTISSCSNLFGIRLGVRTERSREYPALFKEMPFYAPGSNAVLVSKVALNFNSFYNFSNQNANCLNVSVFKTNEFATDTTSMHYVTNSTVSNVPQANIAYFDKHAKTISGFTNCGADGCNGISNVFLKDLDGSLGGSQPGFFVSSALPSITNPVSCTEVSTTTKWCGSQPLNVTLGANLSHIFHNSYTFGMLLIDDSHDYYLNSSNLPNYQIHITSPVGYNNILYTFANFQATSGTNTNNSNSSTPVSSRRMLGDTSDVTVSRPPLFPALVPLGQVYQVNYSNPMRKVHTSLAFENSTYSNTNMVFLEFPVAVNLSIIPESSHIIPLTSELENLTVALDAHAQKCGDYAHDYQNGVTRILVTGEIGCNMTLHTLASTSFTFNLSTNYETFNNNNFSQTLINRIAEIIGISPKQVQIHKIVNLQGEEGTQVLFRVGQTLDESIDVGHQQIENYSQALFTAVSNNQSIFHPQLKIVDYGFSALSLNNNSNSSSGGNSSNGTDVPQPIPSGGGSSSLIYVLLSILVILGGIAAIFYLKLRKKPVKVADVSTDENNLTTSKEISTEMTYVI